MEHQEDFIVSELMAELKHRSERTDHANKSLVRVIVLLVCSLLLSYAGFLLYLNQYDFSGTSESFQNVSAEGVYALIDSEGNAIAYDITEEQMDRFLEELYGEDYENTDNPDNQAAD